MRTVSLPLVGGSYADESRPWSMQDTVNYLPTMAERDGTRSPSMLKTPPGLKPYQTGTEGTVRGTYEAEGRFFAVIGSVLYQVSNAGILIRRGTVPGFNRVQFTHNQISLGNEVVVVNGSAGYVYNTVEDTFARITDEGYPGSSVAAFIDGMVLGIEPQGRYAFNSAPAQATQYNTLDRFTSEFKPDRLVALGVSNNELLLLSAGSGEFFENSGSSEQPFRSKRITMDKGAAGPHVVVGMDNTLLWLGSDGSFYALEGYSPRRISTRPIEQAIDGLNWNQAFGFVWKDNGYEVAYWTFPDGRTWGYDAANREWHRRESDGLNRWRASTMTRWNGKWYAGDYNGPRLYEVDWDYPWEWDQEFASERTCAVMHDNQNRVKCPRLELVMDTGMPEVAAISDFPAQPVGPTIEGAAPDGIVGQAYSFTYTLTEGDAPILKTTLDETALLPGLSWNEDTATISGDSGPSVSGTITITPRVVDANGLWDELTDVIEFTSVHLLSGSVEYAGTLDAMTVSGADQFPRAIGGAGDGLREFATSSNGHVAAMFDGPNNIVRIFRWDGDEYIEQTIAGDAEMDDHAYCIVSTDGVWVYTMTTIGGTHRAYKYTGAGYTFQSSQDLPIDGSGHGGWGYCPSPDGTKIVVTCAGEISVYGISPTDGSLSLADSGDMGFGTETPAHRQMDWVGNFIVGSNGAGGAKFAVYNATTLARIVTTGDTYPSITDAWFSTDHAQIYCENEVTSGQTEVWVFGFDGTHLTPGNTYGHVNTSPPRLLMNPARTHLIRGTGVPYKVDGEDLQALTTLASFVPSSMAWTNL